MLSKKILKRIKRRKQIYIKEGRSDLWHYMKNITDELIKASKAKYMAIKKDQLTATDANRSFFRLVKSFNTAEKPQTFDVRSLCPGSSAGQVAEELADYFNRISSEFDPLTADQIPRTHDRNIPTLELHEVALRIRKFRKPKSMVVGDLFPDLVTKFADFLAVPLTSIFNEIVTSPQFHAVTYLRSGSCQHPAG